MVKGSCMCGEFAYEFTGNPSISPACHCTACRKTTGTIASYCFMVPNDDFKITRGSPRQWSRGSDTGKGVTYNNCATCSVLLFVDFEVYPGVKIVKWGGIDDRDFLDRSGPPIGEIFCRNMQLWETGWGGPMQM